MMDQQSVKFWMLEALKVASEAVNVGQVPVGGVFVKTVDQKCQMVKRAHNMTTKTKNASEHSQMICLKELDRQGRGHEVKDMTLFVTVQPCIMCSEALNIFGIKFVYFGQYNQRFGGCGSVLKCNKFQCRGGYMAEESKQLLKDFYQRGNNNLPEQKRHRKRAKDQS